MTDRADVVLPVAPAVAKSGSYLDWEGRVRLFDATLEQTGALQDARVLDWIAEAMGVTLGTPNAAAAQAEIQQSAHGAALGPPIRSSPRAGPRTPTGGSAVLATCTSTPR